MIEDIFHHWYVVLSIISLIVYLIRQEMRGRALEASFVEFQRARDIRLLEDSEHLKDIQLDIKKTCIDLQGKLADLIEKTGILIGKISVIEKTINHKKPKGEP